MLNCKDMPRSQADSPTMLITGGCGFIGTNVASYFAERGWQVTCLDNMSRPGANHNLQFLTARYPRLRHVNLDITADSPTLAEEVSRHGVVLHLAAQVAVTTSVTDPRTDFNANALGTFNVLEAARRAAPPPLVLYASTNKVYGGLENTRVIETGHRFEYQDLPSGISEEQPLDFHSPYGCSKGAADQYVRDYYRIYGLPTVVLRQSCVYGPRQFGIEDQGWIAWFTIAALLEKPITIYGNGKQVRDVLHIDDLARLYEAVITQRDRAAGNIFNIGGGPAFSINVKEVIPLLETKLNKKLPLQYQDWRPGDQPVYISDITKAKEVLAWQPEINPQKGITTLVDWCKENLDTLRQVIA